MRQRAGSRRRAGRLINGSWRGRGRGHHRHGEDGVALAGTSGKATALDGGVARSPGDGKATTGSHGVAYAGVDGKAVAGYRSVAYALYDGTAQAGNAGVAYAGKGDSKASACHEGVAFVGDRRQR